jgi:DNA-binding NarL/FixJ family response regulator
MGEVRKKKAEEIANMFRSGWTIGYIAELLGVSRTTVKEAMKTHNLTRHAR